MNRRDFIRAVVISNSIVAAQFAKAQESGAINYDDLINLINTPARVDRILYETDALWLILIIINGNRLKPIPRAEAFASYSTYRNQIADPELRRQILPALQNPDVRQRLVQVANELLPVSKKLRVLLVENGIREETLLLKSLLNGFYTFSLLLSARSSQNDRWYCHVYGLELLCS